MKQTMPCDSGPQTSVCTHEWPRKFIHETKKLHHDKQPIKCYFLIWSVPLYCSISHRSQQCKNNCCALNMFLHNSDWKLSSAATIASDGAFKGTDSAFNCEISALKEWAACLFCPGRAHQAPFMRNSPHLTHTRLASWPLTSQAPELCTIHFTCS